MNTQRSASRIPKSAALGLLALVAGISVLSAASSAGVFEHENASCQLCHFGDDASGAAGLARESACLKCHSQVRTGTPAELGFHDGRGRSCSQCHSFHETDELRVPGGRMGRQALHEAGVEHCRSCHGAGGKLADLSAAHWAAAHRYHTDIAALKGLSPSAGCLLCHGSDSDSDWRQAYPEAAVGFDRHKSHPLGVRNLPTREANAFLVRDAKDVALPLPAGNIECQTCHLLPSRTRDLLRVDPAREEICGRCHQRNQPQHPVAAAGLADF